jgi:hypothetical protein
MTAVIGMLGILLRLLSGVKNVARHDLGGDELSQIAQQWLIGRGDHDVAICLVDIYALLWRYRPK